MKKTRLLFLLMLGILFSNVNAQITYSSNQTFRIFTTNPATSVDILFDAIPITGVVTGVTAQINGNTVAATSIGGSRYKVSWTNTSYGNFSLKGFMTTSGGGMDSTFATTIKILQLANCPIPNWNIGTAYSGGDYVNYLGLLYTSNYWTQGNIPLNSTAWTQLGNCSSENYPAMDCSGVPAWDSSLTYGPSNIDINVSHNNLIYRASQWTQNQAPTPGVPWRIVGVCANLNSKPSIQSPIVNSVVTQVTLATIPIVATISDLDGVIAYTQMIVNGSALPISSSGNTYTVNWMPPSYGIFPIQIIAVDDELGTDTLSGTIQVAASVPPVITGVVPVNNKKITTIYNLNTDILTLSSDVIDPDGTIANVTFTLNGQTFTYDNVAGSTYTYDWVPTSYGLYNLLVEATDNSGTISQHQSTLRLVNPLFESLSTANLPLQVQANLGYDKVLDFGEPITAVIVRNRALLSATIAGNQLTISPNKTGRTGLKITTSSGVYYMGVRVNDCDGIPPGMPDYASIGFKSEDSPSDLQFWEDMDVDLTNKNMDVRYIYINDGPIGFNSWRTRNRAIKFCENSLKYGLIPFFVFYNIPDGGESFTTNLAHIRDTAYMKAYFDDLNNFMDDCTDIMDGDLFGVLLEPDFLGYLQQLGVIHLGTNDPNLIQTSVGATTIAPNAGTVRTLVERINKTINDKRTSGANVFFGWQLNLWSAGLNGSAGLMRRTDASDLGWVAGRALIAQAATNTVNYGMNSGILTNNPDFISIDKYGLDAEGYSSTGVTTNPWWFNHDHWDNYMMYAKTMHQVSGANMILWQLPIGRINGSHYESAYTGNTHINLTNSTQKYEDSTIDYFFGDKFTETNTTRFNHFTQNQALDSTISSVNDTITWEQHINKFEECGIIHAMFGAGVGISTDGIGNPAEDDYFSIQKIQEYYEDNLAFLPSAPFTPNVLTYGLTNTTIDLKLVYSGSFNFYGKGFSVDGLFNPMLLGEGIHYVTFVIEENGCRVYKVQKIIITTNTLLSLPSILTKFKAKAVNNQFIQLNWQTENEVDNDYFTIERSKYGLNWEPIAKVKGGGNTTSLLNYATKDEDPYVGVSYYRLKQTSFDEQETYSKIEAVKIDGLEETTVTIYPNPTKKQLTIESAKSELEQLRIYNLLGQDLESSISVISRNQTRIVLELSDLPAGVYIIKTKNISKKFYKK